MSYHLGTKLPEPARVLQQYETMRTNLNLEIFNQKVGDLHCKIDNLMSDMKDIPSSSKKLQKINTNIKKVLNMNDNDDLSKLSKTLADWCKDKKITLSEWQGWWRENENSMALELRTWITNGYEEAPDNNVA